MQTRNLAKNKNEPYRWGLGSVVSRPLGNNHTTIKPYKHYGLIIKFDYLGYPIIRSFYGNGDVRDEHIKEFAKGLAVKNEGFWGNLTPREVVQRASNIHKARYSLINSNCEHFVRYAHGNEVFSKQVNVTFLLIGTIFVAALAFSKGRILPA